MSEAAEAYVVGLTLGWLIGYGHAWWVGRVVRRRK